MRLNVFFASLMSLAALAASANASVVFDLVLDPSTSAGGGSTSTQSGLGTWHLFALDTSDTSLGISSYSVNVTGATSVFHRSPTANVQSEDGDVFSAGFSLLRSSENANWIHASQNLPGLTPFDISRFGQSASDFSTQVAAIDPNATVAPTSLPTAWGSYDTAPAPINDRQWLFLAEGTYAPNAAPTISDARVTVFNPNYSSRYSDVCIGWPCNPIPSPVSVPPPIATEPDPAPVPPPAAADPPPPVKEPVDLLPPVPQEPVVEPMPPADSDPPAPEDPAGGVSDPPLDEPSTGFPWRPIYFPVITVIDWNELSPDLIDVGTFEPVTWVEYHPEFLNFTDWTGLTDEDGNPMFRTFTNGDVAASDSGIAGWLSALRDSDSGAGDAGVPEPSSALLAALALATLTAAPRHRS